MRDYANRSEILNQPRQRYSDDNSVGRPPKKRGWLVVGIIGLVIVVIVAVVMGLRHHQNKTVAQPKTAAAQPVEPKAPPKPQGPVFDFYKLLPDHKKAELHKMQANTQAKAVTSGVSSGAKVTIKPAKSIKPTTHVSQPTSSS